MAIVSVDSKDSYVNSYLGAIASAVYGYEVRSSIADAIDRCYYLAILRAGGSPANGVTRAKINEHLDRIHNAVFGEDVRDAMKTVLGLCYSARGIAVPSTETSYLQELIESQTGEDFKNAILKSIAKCCRDVRVS